MAVTRINNNQITDSIAGNIYVGINAGTKLQDYSITAGKIANSLTYGSDLTITGNLTVNGQTTTIDTVSTVIEDPLIVLASNQTGSPAVDIGFIGERGSSDNIAFVWDESADEFVTAFTTDLVTNTTITISSYANFHTNDANIGGNITINGTTSLVGNISSALNVTGNITGGNLLTPGVVTATGNITGGNLSAGSGIISTTGNINGANVNATSGITAGTTIVATGNITGGNVNTAGQVVATGNITGGNVTTAGLTSTGTLAVSSTSSFTGNITSPFNVTGNIAGGNISTPGLISAVGNINGGNLVTTGVTSTGTLTTTGNALVGGNLIVQGNITYINIDDLRVEDPIIILGTGPNGAPLTVDDGMDRGVYMEYYKTGLGNAFVGWENSSGNILVATSVNFSGNNVVNVLEYGTLQAGNLYIQSAVSTGNVTGGNLNTAGQVVATGNVTGGNINTAGNVNSNQGFFSGNVTVVGTLTSTSNIVANTSGIFFGDAVTGNAAIFAGVPSFTTLGSNVVAQFSGNVNSYSQINFENINSGNRASTDYIATADNGNDSTNYADFGINSSTFDNPVDYPGYGPNDSYVHNNGGNLILNPESSGKTIKLMTGGTANSDVISTVSAQGVFVNVGNLYTPNITSLSGRVTVNSGSDDVDFAVNGDTNANVFYVDAGTGTASFGSATQTTNAIVAFNATNSVLMPVGNTQQRPSTGVVGMLRFNTVGDALEVYDSGGWTEVGTPVFTVIADQQFNGDGSTLVFVLGSEQTTASCIVSINGIIQIPTIAYSVSGTGTSTLTFTEAPEPGDIIDVRQLTTTTTVTAISNTGGNAIVQPNATAAEVDITGDLIPTANVTYDLGSPTARWKDGYFSGSSLILGNVVMKNVAGGNSIGFFGPDGTTPATIAASSVDTTQIASGTSSMAVIASGGNIRANIAGSTVQTISAGLVAITGDLSVSGNATLSGNILGDRVVNGTTSFEIQTPSGNANITIGATSNVAVFTTTGLAVAGTVSVSGTGNVTGANIIATADVFTPEIVKTGSNAVGNIGQIDNYFNRVFAQATSALYADLAEKYVADAEYAPGTVVVFGGDKEVTISSTDSDRAVAGVVSTNPSYIMNSGLEAEHVATVALTGRVPCRVTGSVRKGDLMVSAGYGLARAEADPKVGTVIGKALETHEGTEGVIEVVVGRF
jgi:trimeric autotransporter adhesin